MLIVYVLQQIKHLSLLKLGFKYQKFLYVMMIFMEDDNNIANVPMRQLAGCIPEIADGAARDLFSLLTPCTYPPYIQDDKKGKHLLPMFFLFSLPPLHTPCWRAKRLKILPTNMLVR